MFLELLKEYEPEELNKIMTGDFNQLAKNIANDVRYTNTKKSWKLLKLLSQLTKTTKPISKITVSGTTLTSDNAQKEIIWYFQAIHEGKKVNSVTSSSPEVKASKDDVRGWIHRLNRNKATSVDCIKDVSFHLCCKLYTAPYEICFNKIRLATSIFKEDFWSDKRSNIHFKCRLIALSKDSSTAPELSSIRPIVVASTIIRILEAPIVKALKVYNTGKVHENQAGFQQGKNTGTNLTKLIEHIKMNNNKAFILFFDAKKAFDSVDRSILNNILQGKSVLSKELLNLLGFIFDNICISLGNQSYNPMKGVPLGLG